MTAHCNGQKMSRGRLGVISLKAGEPFGDLLLSSLEKKFKDEGCISEGPVKVPVKEVHFPNGEIKVEILESIRGMDIVVVQDCENKEYPKAMTADHLPAYTLPEDHPLRQGKTPGDILEVPRPFSIDENLRAFYSALDAARRADAHYISGILPAFPYARQDKQLTREGITAANVAEEIESYGAERIFTVDLHNRSIAGFFRKIRCENLHASNVLVPYIRECLDLENLVVGSPDLGGAVRANYYAKMLATRLAMGYKRRAYDKDGKIEEFRILGDVVKRRRNLEEQHAALERLLREGPADLDMFKKMMSDILETKACGYDVLFVDDMIATAGSLDEAVRKAKELGAKDVWFACALGLLTHPAVERIDRLFNAGMLAGVISTNAVYHDPVNFVAAHPWYHPVPIQDYVAAAVFNINHYKSISSLVEGDSKKQPEKK